MTCPHIKSSGSTQYCAMAKAVADDNREAKRILRQALKDIIQHQNVSSSSLGAYSAITAIARRALQSTGGVT